MEKSTIFTEQVSRKPNKYPWTDQFIEAMHNGFWTDKEFSFKSDIQQFKVDLTDQEREIIVRTLSAIGQIEVAVKTFWAKLGENLPHPSLCDLGYVMANVEVIHNNAYERLLQILGLEDIFEENLKLQWIQGRVKYLRKYTHKFYKDSKKQYLYALILFTLFVENVSLFSQFYIINWFARNKNVLKDTDQQVKYTRNEENIHALVGIKIINTIRELETYLDMSIFFMTLIVVHNESPMNTGFLKSKLILVIIDPSPGKVIPISVEINEEVNIPCATRAPNFAFSAKL